MLLSRLCRIFSFLNFFPLSYHFPKPKHYESGLVVAFLIMFTTISPLASASSENNAENAEGQVKKTGQHLRDPSNVSASLINNPHAQKWKEEAQWCQAMVAYYKNPFLPSEVSEAIKSYFQKTCVTKGVKEKVEKTKEPRSPRKHSSKKKVEKTKEPRSPRKHSSKKHSSKEDLSKKPAIKKHSEKS